MWTREYLERLAKIGPKHIAGNGTGRMKKRVL